MYKRLFYACTLAGALLANMSCTSTSDTSVSEINIIPLPSSITQESGSIERRNDDWYFRQIINA